MTTSLREKKVAGERASMHENQLTKAMESKERSNATTSLMNRKTSS